MIEASCKVYSKSTGKEVFKGFKNISETFESVEALYSYMRFRYGYNTKNYYFCIGGRYI